MEDNKIFQDNEKFIKPTKNTNNKQKEIIIESFFTKRNKIRSSQKRKKIINS